jgi:hypothetical protein
MDIESRGQSAIERSTPAMASRGDAGNEGQSQVVRGKRSATAAAVMRAFVEAEEDRNPCR